MWKRQAAVLCRRWASGGPGSRDTNPVNDRVHGFRSPNQEELGPIYHPQNFPDSQPVLRAGNSNDIASEEPIFGKHGYRPLPPTSQRAHNISDAYAQVTMTTTKAVRLPFQGKRILPKPAKVVAIFGCTGYQGSRIAKRLVEAPEIEQVRLCTRYPDQVPADLKKVISLNPEKCVLEETNVLERRSINKALQGCDSVVNAIDMRTDDFYNLHYDVWVKGTSNIGYQARLLGVSRLVQISGLDAIFGNDSDRSDFRSKAEDMALAENFFATILRPGELYGSGFRYSTFGKQWYPTCYPDTLLQPTWVNDLAEACHRVLQDPQSVKRVIDLGGPKVMTHMQFASERALYHRGPAPFPCPTWLGDGCAFFNELLTPRPQFTRDRICEMEMDQISRTKDLNPYIWDWEDLGMQPADMKTAAEREAKGEVF